MYNVLLVDDERFILEGLRRLIAWEELGLEVTGHASSGLEAAEKLATEPYDILITDIKMPDQDGLALLRWVRSRHLPLKCLILSGYDEFDYVKEAIKYGIENYLLKPVSETELISTLLATAEKLDQDRMLQAEKGADIIRNNILFRWLSGDIERDELLQRAPLLHLPVHAPAYAVGIMRAMSAPARNTLAAMLRLCRQLVGEWPHGTTCCNLSDDLICLLPLGASGTDFERATALLSRCAAQLRAELEIEVALAIGASERGRDELHIAYHQALRLLPTVERQEPISPLVAFAMRAVEQRYQEPINVKTLSAEFHINAAYFGQLFKRETGASFTTFLNRVRIARAQELLLETTLKASDVARDVGYPNTSYFCTVFKKLVGVSPQEYRAMAIKRL